MTEESVEGPNWLKELEEKRERRMKARIGHETGAGAPCIKCKQSCPGLDLHFWRKICKLCKCAKEDHDVPDDDCYGWAQFQLLGSKPGKGRKFKLPGKRDEVELEWTPRGQNETVDKYLQTLPPELLPVKGSPAALERKQLLQKQIPAHDIDPMLCHELSAAELKQMNEYVSHVKQHCVGVGRIVQLNSLRHGRDMHLIGGPTDARFLASQLWPMQLPDSEAVKLHGVDKARALAKEMRGLEMKEIPPTDSPMFSQSPNGNHLESYPEPSEIDLSKQTQPFNRQLPVGVSQTVETNKAQHLENRPPLPNYAPGKYGLVREETKQPQYSNIRDLAFSTYNNINEGEKFEDSKSQDFNSNRIYPELKPNTLKLAESVRNPEQVNIGVINDLTYTPTAIEENKDASQLKPESKNKHTEKPETGELPVSGAIVSCHHCQKAFENDAIVIGIDRSEALFHSGCFRCAGCNQSLADLLYFHDKASGKIYCGRDYAKIRGIPRCGACDELIFVKEYCLTEDSTFHVEHFCCFECDLPLADCNYLMEDSRPLCIPCYKVSKAERCKACERVIGPDETGVVLKDLHFHADDACFSCRQCRVPLLRSKFLLREGTLYCSADCYAARSAR